MRARPPVAQPGPRYTPRMFCPGCGAEVVSVALACPRCGRDGAGSGPPPLPRRTPTTTEFFFPKNGPALAAYYLGVFSLIPAVGLVTGILAVVFGVKGLHLQREHPEARGGAHAWTGIVLGGLFALGQVALVGWFLLRAKR
jgi:hypothetical protein